MSSISEKEDKIMGTFAEMIPELSEKDKCYLLGFGEGMAIAKKNQQAEAQSAAVT